MQGGGPSKAPLDIEDVEDRPPSTNRNLASPPLRLYSIPSKEQRPARAYSEKGVHARAYEDGNSATLPAIDIRKSTSKIPMADLIDSTNSYIQVQHQTFTDSAHHLNLPCDGNSYHSNFYGIKDCAIDSSNRPVPNEYDSHYGSNRILDNGVRASVPGHDINGPSRQIDHLSRPAIQLEGPIDFEPYRTEFNHLCDYFFISDAVKIMADKYNVRARYVHRSLVNFYNLYIKRITAGTLLSK